MALLSIFRGTQAECSARPVSDGTLLFATDTKNIYLDKDSNRIEMSSVDDLSGYVTKEQLTTALNGKANTTHTHTQDQVTGLKDALAGKASTSHSHSVASSSASGFMSATDKQKLDGIAAGANKYTLPVASSTALGGVKIGYKESGKNYSVKLDDNNQAYVTVPWTDTTSKDTNTTYSLSKSGSTITLKGSDGSTTSVTDADTNTTYSTFKGATTSAAGGTGLVPAPATGAANRYLRSDGTWQVPPDNNTTYSNMGGASSSAAGHAGLVPAPAAGASNRYLRSDGTWSVPPDNNTNTTYSLSKNGSTITLTGSDGSKTSVTDSNTTYSLSSFGVNASATELNYVKGVTSSIQTQLNSKAASNHTHSFINVLADRPKTANYASSGNKHVDVMLATSLMTEGYPGNDGYVISFNWDNSWWATQVFVPCKTSVPLKYRERIPSGNSFSWSEWSEIYSETNAHKASVGSAAKLATARTISLAGDVTGSANFDGSANISITSNIAAGTVGANELASNAVTNAKIAADSVSLAKLGSDVGTVAVQSTQPSDTNVKLWIQI